MTRKLAYIFLFCVNAAALLPGCQSNPHYGYVTSEETTDGAKPIAPLLPDKSPLSTAMPREEQPKVEAKSSPPKEPQMIVPVQPPEPKLEEPAKKTAGTLGAVSIEPDSKPPVVAGTQAADPPPLPKPGENQRQFAAVVLAFQDILDGRPQDALEKLKAYDPETQELFIRLLPVMSNLVKSPIGKMSAQEIAVLSEMVEQLRATIRPRSELVVNKMCFCRRISGYGVYDALPEDHAFLAGAQDRPGELVQLYVELKNFVSEQLVKGGDFQTKLTCSLELRDSKNEKVWSYTYDRNETTHVRRTRLNDLFSNYSFYVPALPVGTYQLTIQIVDETLPDLRRLARKTLDFRVTPVANQLPPR